MTHILKCKSCNSYGLDEKCTCGSKRERVIPAKYSPEDKYADYRRQAKESQRESEIQEEENEKEE
ncbi:MAG: nucleolar RNA-binding Nop10p family protein [Candidatus Nanoarchaeia archaeon]